MKRTDLGATKTLNKKKKVGVAKENHIASGMQREYFSQAPVG
jgi:hypothetical protein